MKDVKETFWSKWYKANEIERLRLVQTLTGFKNDYSQASLLNSYLTDLSEYIEQNKE